MGKSCLILADSHTGALFGIRKLLEPILDAILMVADERSLLTAIEKSSPALIIVKLSLNVSREPNVGRWMRRCLPDTKFVELSIHDESGAAKECVEAVASAFVLKRSAVNDLVPAGEAARR